MKKLISTIVVLALVLAVLPLAVSAAGTTTVYCDAPDDWTCCYVYWWGSADNNPDWPGVAMTQDASGIWVGEVAADATNVIFTNKEDGSNGVQSSDLNMPTDGNVQYNYEGKVWGAYGSTAEPVEIEYFLRGSMNEWGTANKMEKQADGTYAVTLSLAAGTYEYKAGSEDWAFGCPEANAVLELTADASVTFVLDVDAYTVEATIEGGSAPEATEPEATEPEATEPEATEPEATEPEVDETPDTVVVTAKVPSDWTAASIWAWGANGNAFDAWPGLAMTKDGDVYTAVIPSWVENVIINNGVADGALQTVDLAVVAGKDVNVVVGAVIDNSADDDTTNDANNGKYAAEVTNADGSDATPDAPAVDVSGEYRVVGDAEWLGAWDPANSVGLMTETSAGVYEITFKDVAVGEYQFKITKNGTWADNWGKDGFNTDNIALNVTVAGDVTIVFDANRAAISYKTAASDEMIPVTGDMGIAAVCAALLVASAGLVCVVNKKKEF